MQSRNKKITLRMSERWMNEMEKLFKQGELDDISERCAAFLFSNSPNVDIFYILGKVNYMRGELGRAWVYYNNAIHLDHHYINAHYGLAMIYQDQEKWDQALSHYNTIIKLDSTDAYAVIARGEMYDQKGQWDLAITDYNSAIQLAPTLKPNLEFIRTFDAEKLQEIHQKFPLIYHRAKEFLSLSQRLSSCGDVAIPPDFRDNANTLELMNNPVSLRCGDSVEKSSIPQLKANCHGNCPLCRKAVNFDRYSPNNFLKSKIIEFVEEQEKRFEAPPLVKEEKQNPIAAKEKEITLLKQQVDDLTTKHQEYKSTQETLEARDKEIALLKQQIIDLDAKYQQDEERIQELMKTNKEMPSLLPSSNLDSSTASSSVREKNQLRSIHDTFFSNKPTLFKQKTEDKSEVKEDTTPIQATNLMAFITNNYSWLSKYKMR